MRAYVRSQSHCSDVRRCCWLLAVALVVVIVVVVIVVVVIVVVFIIVVVCRCRCVVTFSFFVFVFGVNQRRRLIVVLPLFCCCDGVSSVRSVIQSLFRPLRLVVWSSVWSSARSFFR